MPIAATPAPRTVTATQKWRPLLPRHPRSALRIERRQITNRPDAESVHSTRKACLVPRAARRRRPGHTNRVRVEAGTYAKSACVRHPRHGAPTRDDNKRSDSGRARCEKHARPSCCAPTGAPITQTVCAPHGRPRAPKPPCVRRRRHVAPDRGRRRAERFRTFGQRNARPSVAPGAAGAPVARTACASRGRARAAGQRCCRLATVEIRVITPKRVVIGRRPRRTTNPEFPKEFNPAQLFSIKSFDPIAVCDTILSPF